MTMKGRKEQVGEGKNEGECPEGKSEVQWKAEEKGQEHRWEASGENEDRSWREFIFAGCRLLSAVQPKLTMYKGAGRLPSASQSNVMFVTKR